MKNKACHYSLIVAQFRDRYIQVKDNEILDSGSLKGDRVRYIQVTALCCKRLFLGSCSVTVLHRVTAIFRAVIYRFDRRMCMGERNNFVLKRIKLNV